MCVRLLLFPPFRLLRGEDADGESWACRAATRTSRRTTRSSTSPAELPRTLLVVPRFVLPPFLFSLSRSPFSHAQYVLPDNSTAYLGAVGSDSLADQLRAANEKEGLYSAYQVVEDKPTGACAVVITGHDRCVSLFFLSYHVLHQMRKLTTRTCPCERTAPSAPTSPPPSPSPPRTSTSARSRSSSSAPRTSTSAVSSSPTASSQRSSSLSTPLRRTRCVSGLFLSRLLISQEGAACIRFGVLTPRPAAALRHEPLRPLHSPVLQVPG
jgi:hypothetical protein